MIRRDLASIYLNLPLVSVIWQLLSLASCRLRDINRRSHPSRQIRTLPAPVGRVADPVTPSMMPAKRWPSRPEQWRAGSSYPLCVGRSDASEDFGKPLDEKGIARATIEAVTNRCAPFHPPCLVDRHGPEPAREFTAVVRSLFATRGELLSGSTASRADASATLAGWARRSAHAGAQNRPAADGNSGRIPRPAMTSHLLHL